MSWLKDLAKENGYRSLRALALGMAKSEAWPTEAGREIESIANKLRHADQRKDVEWWSRAGQVFLRPLAATLGKDEEEVRRQLLEGPGVGSEGGALWSFEMCPALRPLDLRSELPFPGIPLGIHMLEVLVLLNKVWWIAPAGAGKTLMGRAFRVKHQWETRSARKWKDAQPLPEQGKVFLELGSTADLTGEMLQQLPKELLLCIAAPVPPPTVARKDGEEKAENAVPNLFNQPSGWPQNFQVIQPPSPKEWTPHLIDWVEKRIKKGGKFNADGVRQLFKDPNMEVFATPGELLGFFGMLDQLGLERATGKVDLARWIRGWLRAALERPDRRCPVGVAERLRKRGAKILVEMEKERIRRELGESLPRETWTDLVPGQEAPALDREELLAALETGGEEAVRRMLTPDGDSIVGGLEVIGALAQESEGHLALRPLWVTNVLRNAALRELSEDSPDGIGTLLLNVKTAAVALQELIDEAREGRYERIQRALDKPPATPEQLAAVDGAFRALGLAIAQDVRAPAKLARLAWDRQMAHVARRFTNWPPVPIVAVASASAGLGGITDAGAWCFAAFLVSQSLMEQGADLAPSALNPWRGCLQNAEERSACAQAFSAAAQAMAWTGQEQQRLPSMWAHAVYRLGGKLLDACGIMDELASTAQGPDALALLARGQALSIERHHGELLCLPWGLSVVEDACRRRGSTLEEVVKWAWSHLQTKGGRLPAVMSPQRDATPEEHETARRLWAATDASWLSPELLKSFEHHPRAWPFLTEAIWERWLKVQSEKPEPRWGNFAEAVRIIPERLVLQTVRDGNVDPWAHEVRKALWERMPAALIALIDELAPDPPRPHPKLKDHGGPISDLVFSAPEQYRLELVERARRWAAEPTKYPAVGRWLQSWLLQVIEQRGPGWRSAFDVLGLLPRGG